MYQLSPMTLLPNLKLETQLRAEKPQLRHVSIALFQIICLKNKKNIYFNQFKKSQFVFDKTSDFTSVNRQNVKKNKKT
jgi:hypothetical protein